MPWGRGEKEEAVGANGHSRSNKEVQGASMIMMLWEGRVSTGIALLIKCCVKKYSTFYFYCHAIAWGRKEEVAKANGHGGHD